ncbi:antitoxin [Tenuibacillus multivorans]|uniref:CopG family transcriptional regulator / antitoxin EndoAI n=1 Tax=Tenuibacillus multivorans TaxID=237069 RepID=A0A1H0BAC4_9BACI|nr:antitoxin [Tenuibacillus multivorans]GEL78770.1 antitoxin EndoAI [Tenuibacillus multivorans]SDN42588.1 CopG family transcriptional regulator / antitoxin EndoAI [Tenuibacillus multivorans]
MSESSKEIVVKLPTSLLNECDSLVQNQDDLDRETLIMQAVNAYVQDEKKRKIKEKMRRGYVEMRNINLGIASEAFVAEEEAETTLERLVSGV